MKLFATLLLGCIVVLAINVGTASAVTSEISTGQSEARSVEPQGPFSVEGLMQFNSVAGEASPLIGASMGYFTSARNEVAFRALMPVTVDKVLVYSMQIFDRYYFSESKTALFVEGDLAYNYKGVKRSTDNFDGQIFPSGGLALGVRHFLNRDITIGGVAGMEMSFFGSKEEFLTPKLAMTGSFRF